ncbi:undecaprenyl-phosphate galactose phosphotransferase WbaP [Shewanella sp. C32]|uniref:Undecaprenyl-phosphate galactose phosphotransferase WbaP n=1 Tax=Shewanella electrica TaxID=515560 RepID=A0ABT2FMR4_9GAMM|nr:undecaprenyl-phosphate galactose phosphotransferase WbaP [Shewanella electrica]MCH1924618.1 undecaprenyl-phosphate galactose phosphotransferase WbaP [Shewanella electrica]MCS4556519.1 undecaprenyl-phosphate galactose phosphotransferase WbaP [Shewanella electrica]
MDMPQIDTAASATTRIFSPMINKASLLFSDVIAFVLAYGVTCLLLGSNGFESPEIFSTFDSHNGVARVWAYALIVLSGVTWSWTKLRHYTYRKPFWSELKECLQLLLAMAVADLALIALSKWDFSRGEWLLLWTLCFVLVPTLRYFTKVGLRKLGFWQFPSFIVGSGRNAADAYRAIQSEALMGFDIQGFICATNSCKSAPIEGIPLLNLDMETVLLKYRKSKLFLAFEYEQTELRDNWLRYLSAKGMRNVSVIPTLRGVPLYGTDMSHFFSHELIMLRVQNNLARISSRMLKRVFDIVVSGLLLLILSPLLGYIAWKASRDGGSPTYGHERVGQHGKKFKCLKFRSMVSNSKEVLEELLANDPEARAEWFKDFKLKNDPRITPIGHFLRKTSLDELPQLWNVFKGEMSLVGPRPVVDAELERYGDDAEYYLMAKPGMSGLWQVSGRNDVDYATRVYLDGWYVKNWSLWYDIAILFKTVGVVLHRDGAY